MIKTSYYQDLTKMNTFGMKVKARCFMEYDSVADLVDIEFEELARPVLHIGGGSNLLFTDDFKGTVLHSRIDFIEILEDCQQISSPVLVSVGAGVVFDDFCAWAAKEGLWGVENLSYIPGEVGASAVQNIGAYGVEVKDVIHTVYCYDTVEEEFVKFDVSECGYGYRDSIFKSPEIKGRYIVTHVVFALSRVPMPKLEYGHLKDAVESSGNELTPSNIRNVIIRIRKEKLPEPSVMGSAGSFFKNPVISQEHFARIEAAAKAEHGADYKVPHYDLPDGTVKVPAAWMIEQCGWKGRRSGGAAVYEKQPLVIVNYTGEAYPEEIIGLEKRVTSSVKEKFGVDLHPEVEHI
ncbi:MAG: UDP-N-acetylmuramate dehydrogenase [Bacteroidales bacterium]|nr:UDP-N-acetylmuramate dehydrogenase [Bacteroidales bacterium]